VTVEVVSATNGEATVTAPLEPGGPPTITFTREEGNDADGVIVYRIIDDYGQQDDGTITSVATLPDTGVALSTMTLFALVLVTFGLFLLRRTAVWRRHHTS